MAKLKLISKAAALLVTDVAAAVLLVTDVAAAAILWIGFTGCAAQTESKAIEKANAVARADGYDLRQYEPHARYNLSGDGLWTVFYHPRPDARGGVAIGDDFSVHLNRAGAGELIPGR